MFSKMMRLLYVSKVERSHLTLKIQVLYDEIQKSSNLNSMFECKTTPSISGFIDFYTTDTN